MLPSIAVQQPVCPMIPKLCASLAVSPPSPDSLEGHGESAKWMRGCWWSRSLSFGSLLMLTMLLISIVLLEFHTQVASPWRVSGLFKPSSVAPIKLSTQNPCEKASGRYKRMGIDTLPRGIVQETTDLQFRALGADPVKETQWLPSSQSLLTMPVGVQQKEMVNKIIEKFPEQNFTVMLFHYDGKVDEWKTFPWSNRAIHVAAANQTKWWFAKRFLHPDIVSSYKYIFLWDEDIGVENFHAVRYLEIVEREGLEISQPALDAQKSEVHHQITVRRPKGLVHRRIYKFRGSGLCFENSTKPPCTGWVEMMVPVFSQAAWRCAWYMIQNDLVHAWGLDTKLGYCAQGDPSKKVGVVDDQYIVHFGIPSLGGLYNTKWDGRTKGVSPDPPAGSKVPADASFQERGAVRRRSYVEQDIFRKRWNNAAIKDKCWPGRSIEV
ncbi:hypothetical protein GOP47_0013980 [Adiantum capillus-veneris]|uniref:Uncharacterized protein n=1 Tax=Adiantum capillus-veneris TaxID=13818 RepID=A0A9D4UQ17_ADICA|nr:hypothetical protein GOP47_0013980 [Adiantum capillus-veneris]